MNHLFFAENLNSDSIDLGADDARHLIKVLRAKLGDEIHLTDGKGIHVIGEIVALSKGAAQISVLQREEVVAEENTRIHLAVGVPKKSSRWEWLLEKAVELGLSSIIPLRSENSEPFTINRERCTKIMRGAMKQSQRMHLPDLEEVVSLEQLLSMDFDNAKRYVACMPLRGEPRKSMASGPKLVCVGPEGGFSPAELDLFRKESFIAIGLGDYRLRTETAAISVLVEHHRIGNSLD